MARFSGNIGFAVNQEIRPGVWEDVIIARKVFGDVLRNTRKLDDGARVNGNLTIGNTFSIVLDAFVNENIFAIRYVEWKGVLWTCDDIEVVERRLIIRPGGVYNGPKA
jgi:hypothetical protein